MSSSTRQIGISHNFYGYQILTMLIVLSSSIAYCLELPAIISFDPDQYLAVLVSICVHWPRTAPHSRLLHHSRRSLRRTIQWRHLAWSGTLNLMRCPYHRALVAQLQSPNDKSCDGPQQFLILLAGYHQSQFLQNFFNSCGRITLARIPQWMRSFALVGRW